MSDRGPTGSQSSGLTWQITTLGLGLLAAITIISVSGGDVNALNNTLGKLLAAVGAAGGLGAWISSNRAARQTNGVMDERIAQGVETGITRALAEARRAQASPDEGPPA